MSLDFEPTNGEGIFTHVQDMSDIERIEARRRLEFITAKLGNEALKDIDLGLDPEDYELVA